MGTNTTGFVKDYNNNTNGSESTYFSDVGQIYPFCFGYCGGLSANAGAFYLGLYYYGSDSSSNLGARLMYKHLKDA